MGSVFLFAPADVQGQLRGLTFDRPSDERPELPDVGEEEGEPARITKPVPLPGQVAKGISDGQRFPVKTFIFRGNHEISDTDLRRVAAPYSRRELSYADIQALRDELTLLYVNRGFATSGVTIPEQSVLDGILEFEIVEGTLAGVEIKTDGRYRSSVLRDRFRNQTDKTVHVGNLEERIRLLQSDPHIARANAELVPTAVRGESILQLTIEEHAPYSVRAEANNHRSPGIGAEGGIVSVGYGNATGIGDQLVLGYSMSEGLSVYSGMYSIPINRYQTLLEVHGTYYEAQLVETINGADFEDFDIENRSYTVGTTIDHPVILSPKTRLGLLATAEYRVAKSTIFDECFRISNGPDCETRILAMRVGTNWTHRTRLNVFAVRSMLNWGIDAFDDETSTQDDDLDLPQADFVSWLTQAQWARRTGLWGSVVILRTDLQLSTEPLFSMEQFSTGGHSRVRGYRENTAVRDNGAVGSLEFRLPLLRRSDWFGRLELSTFADGGYSWNTRQPDFGEKTLASAGLGLHWLQKRWFDVHLQWSQRFTKAGLDLDQDLQDYGLTFRIVARWPHRD